MRTWDKVVHRDCVEKYWEMKTHTHTQKYGIRQCVEGKVELISVALMCFGKVTEENHDKHQNVETI